VLLAPYLGHDAPTNRPDSGGWAHADVPRFLALAALHHAGIDCCEQLPTLAFAVPANSSAILAASYSYRLMRNFATRGYREDFAATAHPVTLFAGADDELMLSDKYADAIHAVAPKVDVKLIDGVNHMSILSDPRAVSVIAEDVAKRGMAGT
jgi:alpha-beta hydrolase superfamily lysophospholipase